MMQKGLIKPTMLIRFADGPLACSRDRDLLFEPMCKN